MDPFVMNALITESCFIAQSVLSFLGSWCASAPYYSFFSCETCYSFFMAAITFDTLKFTKRLKEAGFPEAQAEALVDAVLGATSEAELVTKKDLQIELAPLKMDLTLIKWMLGLLLGGVVALLLKAFSPF
jgi:hypothetical protein